MSATYPVSLESMLIIFFYALANHEFYLIMAERVRFEPTLGFPKHAFQACAFGLSATSPFDYRSQFRVRSSEYKSFSDCLDLTLNSVL